MRKALKVLLIALALVFAANAQSRTSMNDLLLPAPADVAAAADGGFEVFKILPRGMFDYERNELSLRGGGAYYSFVNKSHSYNEIPQLELQQDSLSVGFYGANYGLLADLGETSLADLDRADPSVDYLLKYQPKTLEPEAREETDKIFESFKSNVSKFNYFQPAVVGHAYVLRAISFGEADTLVAFKIQRKEADGSFVIFWKPLENFAKPVLVRDSKPAVSNDRAIPRSSELTAKVEKALWEKGFTGVRVTTEGNRLVLSGTVPKGKLPDAVGLALSVNGKPVINHLTEK
jgi:hypothetical protein